MKKHYFFKFILLLIPASAFILLSFSGGIGGSRSGSPGDGGTTCTACHAPGANFGASASISTNIPASGYELNTNYQITVNASSSASGHGFQLTSERIDTNAKVGSFTAGTGSVAQNGGNAVSHQGISASGNWTFTWTSPSTDVGDVTFYAAVNAVNGNGSTSGDQVVTTSQSVITNGVLGITDAKRLNFEMFPNPASENVTIQLPTNSENALVEFYDYVGRLALSKKVSDLDKVVNVSSLSSGIYMIKVISNDKIGSQKFIKK